MPVTISESYLSRPFTLAVTGQSGRELVFEIDGTDDEEVVRLLLQAAAPAAYLGRLIESFQADPVSRYHWKGYARYVRFEDDAEYSFDTAGGTQKITQSLGTVNAYAPPGLSAPDFRGAIGVTEDSVEGVDVTVPQFSFSETHRFADAYMAAGFKRTLFLMTGCVNNSTFKGLNAGECLFLGASGQKRGDEQWSITFRFSGSQNVSGLTVGDITGIDKFGWDYLWVRYGDYEDSGAKALVKRPIAAYVERVYQPADFSSLGIGIF